MPPETPRTAFAAWLAAGLALLLAACASQPPAAPAAQGPTAAAPAPEPQPAPAPTVVIEAPSPAMQALVHADRVRGLPISEVAQEITRLSAVVDEAERRGATAPLAQMQLALTLMQTRAALDTVRAAQLLQRVLAQPTPEARSLHPLARQLVVQLAEQKRLEDLVERQGQQLRDAQRRADQLNERLDALRAIERSRPRPQ